MSRADDKIHLYIAVDEKGNLGKSLKGERFYTIVGSIVLDRGAFEAIAQHYAVERGREVKYHDDEDFREPIVRRAAPYVEDVYYVKYRKDPKVHNTGDGLPKDRKVAKHIAMLQALANEMLADAGYGPVDVDIDYNRLVSGEPVPETFECSLSRDGREVVCRVQNSKDNYGLMTNDFIVGAVGDRYSDLGDKEAKNLVGFLRHKPKEVHLHDENRKPRRYLIWEF